MCAACESELRYCLPCTAGGYRNRQAWTSQLEHVPDVILSCCVFAIAETCAPNLGAQSAANNQSIEGRQVGLAL